MTLGFDGTQLNVNGPLAPFWPCSVRVKFAFAPTVIVADEGVTDPLICGSCAALTVSVAGICKVRAPSDRT